MASFSSTDFEAWQTPLPNFASSWSGPTGLEPYPSPVVGAASSAVPGATLPDIPPLFSGNGVDSDRDILGVQTWPQGDPPTGKQALPKNANSLTGALSAVRVGDALIGPSIPTLALYSSRTTVDRAGNTLGKARNIGTLTSSQTFSDWVGSSDTNDYYRFALTEARSFSLRLDGLSADADVQLLSSTGATIVNSTQGGKLAESISRSLTAGTYYVRVYPHSGSTSYNLTLSSAPFDRAGNSLGAARNIGTLSTSQSFSDWVGSADTNDYYRFDLYQPSNLSLSLNGLSSDANVQLLNSAGGDVASSIRGGTTAESISRELAAGTYYVRAYQNSGDTFYNLTLSATPTDHAGNTSDSPRNIGTLTGSQTFSDWVGSSDRNDFYRFDLATASSFSLSCNGTSPDARIMLFKSGDKWYEYYLGTASIANSINSNLESGTYFVLAQSARSDWSYSITLSATPSAPKDNAGNTLAAARNVGTLTNYQAFTDWVGSGDTNDFYRFDLATASTFTVGLYDTTSYAQTQLLNSAGGVVPGSDPSSTFGGSINYYELAAGTYYMRVYPYVGNTFYDLTLSATPKDNAGNTLPAARNIGTLTSAQTFSDWVDSVDTNDYYRLDLATASSFSLSLNGLSADANVELLNSTGGALASSTQGGTTAESISRDLAAGTYYVRVNPASGNTSYNLTLSATPPGPIRSVSQ
jgi:hypothetical protein